MLWEIHSVEEILWREVFSKDTDSELRKEIIRCLGYKEYSTSKTPACKEYQKHAYSQNKQKHILNAIIIKSYMKSMDETVELTAEEGKPS